MIEFRPWPGGGEGSTCTTPIELLSHPFSIHRPNAEGAKDRKEGGAAGCREPGSLSDHVEQSLPADGCSAPESLACLLQQLLLLLLTNKYRSDKEGTK